MAAAIACVTAIAAKSESVFAQGARSSAADKFAVIEGVVVDSAGRARVTGRPRGFGNGCVTWWVDGNRWLGEDIEDFIRPDEVAAVEVYSGAFTPSQFQAALSDCETVVLWTKQNIH